MHSMKKILFKIVMLSAVVLFAGVVTVQAQEQPEPGEEQPVPTWVKTFGKQLKASLESENPFIKRDALQHITYFASFYETGIDFSDTVPTLIDLYRNDNDADVRLFSLVALYAIGDESGMKQVRRSMYEQRWPPRLQWVTMAALVSYFGPETFSMDREAAVIAQNLMDHYTQPRVEVGPLEVVQPQQQENQQR